MEQGQELSEYDFLTPQEVAEIMKISLSQVYLDMKQNPPPYPYYFATATKRRVKRADLAAYLEKRKVSAEATSES